MDRFTTLLQEQFGATIADSFLRRASYNSAMDFLEYVSQDTTVIADRVDDFLTVLRSADDREIIGFRLKGFGYVIRTHMKDAMELEEEHFNPIIFMLEAFFTDFGNQIFGWGTVKDDRRRDAYRRSLALAKNDNVVMPEELKAA